ncbi:7-cyano-7-deazaguanine synthase QueC [Micromonospora sp. NBC_01813]|uniref:7-cyano-7-deazaguanine synthase QueC n=1 Tax=Micromonospora sp. NBC_01813 TaxID=2975988 RepID=UPI002DDAD540|nr:7-cyano-7-deazaguanine synthase QueC [Micromonospora sp. NBC_01813]WSA07029.1 7-cyano-7-deazaguanine synthase QueC [Micromonospora sp. NBC_01813]
MDTKSSSSQRRAVVVLSGGLDSTVLAYRLSAAGWRLTTLTFNYGQTHRREIQYAWRTAAALGGVTHRVVNLGDITDLLAGSALTDSAVEIPDGHYTDPSMRATVVPNRTAIMLDIATAHAIATHAQAVAFGGRDAAPTIHPDHRPEFVTAYERATRAGNDGYLHPDFQLLTPFTGSTKADIVAEGVTLRVPFADTWSCYKGRARHCAACGACVARREAFFVAGVPDPTEYEQP